jgi:hypothetical protein
MGRCGGVGCFTGRTYFRNYLYLIVRIYICLLYPRNMHLTPLTPSLALSSVRNHLVLSRRDIYITS